MQCGPDRIGVLRWDGPACVLLVNAVLAGAKLIRPSAAIGEDFNRQMRAAKCVLLESVVAAVATCFKGENIRDDNMT